MGQKVAKLSSIAPMPCTVQLRPLPYWTSMQSTPPPNWSTSRSPPQLGLAMKKLCKTIADMSKFQKNNFAKVGTTTWLAHFLSLHEESNKRYDASKSSIGMLHERVPELFPLPADNSKEIRQISQKSKMDLSIFAFYWQNRKALLWYLIILEN